MFDALFQNARTLDGLGGNPFTGDVGVRGDRIVDVGDLGDASARRVIDAAGKCLSPGFIDMHSHSDLSLMVDGDGRSKIFQGVTSELNGCCGCTPYPVSDERRGLLREGFSSIDYPQVEWRWRTLDDHARDMEERGISLNFLPQVGHSAVRTEVMGPVARPATREETDAMRRLIAEAMEQGAFGFSVGLTLAPSAYGDTAEVIELARVAGRYGGIYNQHSRLNATNHRAAVEEAVAVGRAANVRVQVSHQKIVGRPFWGQLEDVLECYADAVSDGVEIGFDLYPYLAGKSSFNQLLPIWAMEGGVVRMVERLRDPADRAQIRDEMAPGWFGGVPWDWPGILITDVHTPELSHYAGKTVAEAAEMLGADPLDAALTLVERDNGHLGCAFFTDSDDNVKELMKHELAVIGSDGLAVNDGDDMVARHCHPRYFGAFPRVLETYVRKEKVLTLPEAVAKMTSRTAERLGLTDRGVVAPGKAADLLVFDFQCVHENATFADPARYSEGFSHVMVNGQFVVDEGRHTGARPGRVLRRA